MCDPIPSCAVSVYFYEGSPETVENPATPSRFAYCCTNYASGWHIETDGSIHPPSKDRIVRISLKALPNLTSSEAKAKFAGLQLSTERLYKPNPAFNWTPEQDLVPGVTVTTPDGYPADDMLTIWRTTGPLTIDFTKVDKQLYYCLAVAWDGQDELHWDDPKIYDDGSL